MRVGVIVLGCLLLSACQSSDGPPSGPIDGGPIDGGEIDACDWHWDNEDCSGDTEPANCCAGVDCDSYWCSDGTIYRATQRWSCDGATCTEEIQYECTFTTEGGTVFSACPAGCASDQVLQCGAPYHGDAGVCEPTSLCNP